PFEEPAHVRVRFPEVASIGRLDADAVRPVSDGWKHVLDGPGLRIEAIDHSRGRHRHPELSVLRLLTVRPRAGRRGSWITSDRAASTHAQPVRGALASSFAAGA